MKSCTRWAGWQVAGCLLLLLACSARCPAQQLIEKAETVPAADQWLQPGDHLQVRLKGRPGSRVTFYRGQRLTELATQPGLYQATYVVQPGDTLRNRPLQFTLVAADSSRAVAFSKSKVLLLNPNEPVLARTTSNLSYLNYGLGEDRLGGAKLGYLDSAVVLHLTGRVGNLYRVRLAEAQTAWVPQDQVQLLPPGGFVPTSLTGSWRVEGDTAADYVRVPLTARLPYRSQILTNPTRLEVDVFGATSNTNWITQRDGLRELGDVHYEQIAPDVFRLVLLLKHTQSWGYHIGYEGTTLAIQVRRPPEKLRLRGLLVAVDAGHGGTNVGATGASGAREKDLTLAIARQLQQELERRGARVVMTRTTDASLEISDRVRQLRRRRPALLVSVHVNSSGNAATQGTNTYYRYVAFRPLSVALYGQMRRTGLGAAGNVGSFNFGLNGPTEYPNALVETAFVSNPEDEKRLTDPQFQREMARRMALGIKDFVRGTRAKGLKGWLLGRPAEQ